MFKKLFIVLFKVIAKLISIILMPIDLLISGVFPDVSARVTQFTTIVNTYIGNSLAWFFNLLPPYTRGLVAFYLGFLISYYTITYSVHLILRVIALIKKVKIW